MSGDDGRKRIAEAGDPVNQIDVQASLSAAAIAAAVGLDPAGLPSVENAVPVTPSRNRMYAAQWFSFAAIALLIYGLAVRKRLREEPRKP